MDVLVNCEESGIVKDEFIKLGHNAWSCDLVPSRVPGNHLQMDARKAITVRKWDLIINHPPMHLYRRLWKPLVLEKPAES